MKIDYTIANGLQILGVDGTNPVIFDNDMVMDTPEITLLWLKANRRELNLVGNVSTADMYYQYLLPSQPEGNPHTKTFEEWVRWWGAANSTGLMNIPQPIMGSTKGLRTPSNEVIESTLYTVTPGSTLIVQEARKATPQKPLIVVVGGNVSTVATAYLQDNSIADKVVVIHIYGYQRYNKATLFNNIDAWSTYIAMEKFRYVMWKGDQDTGYDGVTPIPATLGLESMPVNPFTSLLKIWINGYYSVYKNIGDAPMAAYLFDHSLFKNVVRKKKDSSTTTSDTFDFLLVSENRWDGYWPIMRDYLLNPTNYIPAGTPPPNNPIPPLIEISNTEFNYPLNEPFTITANASSPDNTPITLVEFYHGTKKFGESAQVPYSKTLTISNPGVYTMSAKAIDNRGLSTLSESKDFDIQEGVVIPPENIIPIVSISNLGNEYEEGAVSLTATASDEDGFVTKVEFFSDGIKIDEDTQEPYEILWGATVGSHIITAIATDNIGATGVSESFNITIIEKVIIPPENIIPIVSITNLENEYEEGVVSLTATASDEDGFVTKVEFFDNGIKIDEDTEEPYLIVWVATVGDHSIIAIATDNIGATGVSESFNITITEKVIIPPIIVSPYATVFTYKNFGAKGDGSTDDTLAIQNCWDAAIAVRGKVLVEAPSYGYKITDSINVVPSSGQQTWVDLECIGGNVNQHLYHGPSNKPVFKILGLKGSNWHGLNVTIANGQTNVQILDVDTTDTQPSSSFNSFYDSWFILGTGENTVGVRTGHLSGGGADISNLQFFNCRVKGSRSNGQIGYLFEGRNTLANCWFGGMVDFCETIFSNHGPTNIRGNGSCFFYGMNSSHNIVNYVFDFENAYTVLGGRYELDDSMLRTVTGSHHTAITFSGVQMSGFQGTNLFELNNPASVIVDNCRMHKRQSDVGFDNLFLLNGNSGAGSISIRGGGTLAQNLYTKNGSTKWKSVITSLGKYGDINGVNIVDFYQDEHIII